MVISWGQMYRLDHLYRGKYSRSVAHIHHYWLMSLLDARMLACITGARIICII